MGGDAGTLAGKEYTYLSLDVIGRVCDEAVFLSSQVGTNRPCMLEREVTGATRWAVAQKEKSDGVVPSDARTRRRPWAREDDKNADRRGC